MISVIIPTYNEAENIGLTISNLFNSTDAPFIKEIIICDGGSSDDTIKKARYAGVKIVRNIKKGRAAQMNAGAAIATGDVFYFLHADTLPPPGFTKQITDSIQQGYTSGCYRLQFDYAHWFLKSNCWFTRFDVNAVRFGDQSLFVVKDIFEKAGGYNAKLIMLEDQEIIRRIKRIGKFKVLNGTVITSARKYLDNGIYRTQMVFYLIYFLYALGFSQQRLLKLYRKLIRQNKL